MVQKDTKPATDDKAKFDIPKIVKEKYPDLVALILKTESMNDDERQYWFQILPIMTEIQVEKLREILETEKKELAQIDQEYEEEVKNINEKHMSQWQEFEMKEKREKLTKAEGKAEEAEKAEEEEILKQLEGL